MEILNVDQAVISIVYNDEYYGIIHQIPNIKGKTEHESYNDSLNILMSMDVFFTIYFPYEIEYLAKNGHLALMIQNPGLIHKDTDYLITYPEHLTTTQIKFLDSQEETLKKANEINFERYYKKENAFYTIQNKRKNDFLKYKEYLQALKLENLTRNRTLD